MATIQEISAEDFDILKKDPIASQEYYSLAEKEQNEYENKYTSKFSEEFKMIRSQIMDSQEIDSKSAGQILLREIKRAHEAGNFFMDSSGNVDRDKFNQVRATITRDVESGRYDSLIQRNQKVEVAKADEIENKNSFEKKMDEINNSLKNYTSLSEEEKRVVRKNFIHELSQMSDEDRDQAYDEFGIDEEARKQFNKLCECEKYIEEHKKEFLEQHPELDENEDAAEIEQALTAQFCEEYDIEPQELAEIDDALDKSIRIIKLQEEINNIQNNNEIEQEEKETKIAIIQNDIEKYKVAVEQTISKLSDKDKQEFDKKAEKILEEDKNFLEDLEIDEQDESISLDDLYDDIEIDEQDEGISLDDLDDGMEIDEQDEGIALDDLYNDIEIDNQNEDVFIEDSNDELVADEQNNNKFPKDFRPGIDKLISEDEKEGKNIIGVEAEFDNYQQDYIEETKENPFMSFIRKNIIDRIKSIRTPKLAEGQFENVKEDKEKQITDDPNLSDLLEGNTAEVEEKNELATQNRFSKLFNRVRGVFKNIFKQNENSNNEHTNGEIAETLVKQEKNYIDELRADDETIRKTEEIGKNAVITEKPQLHIVI